MTEDRVVDLSAAPIVLSRRAQCRACGANMRRWSTAYRVAGGYVHARCRAKAAERGRLIDTETGEIVEA